MADVSSLADACVRGWRRTKRTKVLYRQFTSGARCAIVLYRHSRARWREVVPPRGAMMRKLMTVALGSTAIVAMACGKSKSNATSLNDDLKRDLQLATQSQSIQISPDEISPRSHQEMAVRPKKAPDGPRTIRSQHPTRRASAAPVEAAEVKTELPPAQVMASATAPAPSETPSPDSPPLARPSPVPAQNYPSTGRIPESGPGGVGSVLGGIFGAVIRGGVVGDDDHCDPRRPPMRRGGMGGDLGGMIGGIIIHR